jgi:pimeloyl-ACP methyl ester carboxylesterase
VAVLAPDRFRRLALLSGVAGPEIVAAEGGAVAFLPRLASVPQLGRLLLRTMAALARRPRAAAALLRPLDFQLRRFVTDPGLHRIAVRTLRASLGQGVAQGAAGLLADVAVLTRPWEIAAAGPDLPALILHGSRDWIVPLAHARYYRSRLPRAEWLVTEDEHVSAIVNQRQRLLAWLSAD